MKKHLAIYLLLFLSYLGEVLPISISLQNAEKIGNMIWKNECGGTIEGLTHWNNGENFASLGIGHFIWYPTNTKDRFEETFPDLLKFLQKEGTSLPTWLKNSEGCPWSSREKFYENIQSPEMKNLRQFLFDTRNLQIILIVNRLESNFLPIIESCPEEEKKKIKSIFLRLAQEPSGLYALIDYLNFKGAGTSVKEMYKGEGWGLLQVLQHIPLSSPKPIIDFVEAAKTLLRQRVKNSSAEKHEDRWLKGWFNRLDTYLDFQ